MTLVKDSKTDFVQNRTVTIGTMITTLESCSEKEIGHHLGIGEEWETQLDIEGTQISRMENFG